MRRDARNMKLQVKAMKVGELLEKGSMEYETWINSNESKRGIGEGRLEA